MIAFFGTIFGILVLVMLALLSFLWVFALIDILRSNFKSDATKILWFLVVLFSHFLGTVLYFIFGKEGKVT